MKNFLFFISLFIVINSFSNLAYGQRTCGADDYHNENMKDPEYNNWFIGVEKSVNDRLGNRQNSGGLRNQVLVPVAIHFNGTVTEADRCCLIQASLAQIQVLNDDFSAINSDKILYENIAQACPNNFPISALSNGANIQFFLATSNHPIGSGLVDGEYAITVGQKSWPNAGPEWTGYLNIFVPDYFTYNGQPVLGIAPISGGANPNGNGVLIIAPAFGGPGVECYSGTGINTDSKYNLGRTTTHEVGHYFGLYHIFAGCNNGDGIDDTPNQNLDNFGAHTVDFNTCNSTAENSCGSQDFFMNYMDYSDDISLYMFTKNQVSKMDMISNHNQWKQNTDNGINIPQLSTYYYLPEGCSQFSSFNLNSIDILNEIPCNSIVVWSLDDNPNDGISILTDTEISEPGNYYAYFYNTTHDYYSSPSQPFVVNFCNVMDLEVSSNYLIDSDQEFIKIVIESNGVLTITSNATVKLVDKIEIKSGGKLIVNGATLTNCPCVSTWQGIKAWGNPYTNQSHAVELINGAIIENAEIGINTSNIVPGFFPGTFVDLSGAKITSDNSTIRNCEVGVNFGPYGYSTWFSSYDQSYFNNTVFESCGTGAILNSNAGIEFSYSSFTGMNSIGIDLRNSNAYVSGCDFSGYQGILFSAIWPNLLGSEVINNAFLNGINGDGIIMDAQGNASSHYIAGNFFESISGIHGLGQSFFNIQANDFVNNIVGVSSWFTGDDYNLVSDNDFLGNEYGNSAYGNNNIEYLSNCFDYSGTADIELYSGASIFVTQGDENIAAGNCFSYLTNRILTGFGSIPFDYYILKGTLPQSCKQPGYGNFNVELSDQEFGLNCGSGVWNSLPPRYRNCVIPASLEDKKLMQTALEKEIDRIKKDPNISQSLKKWLIARYERCLKSLKGAKGLQIIHEEQDGKERGIEYFSNQSLFSHKIMAYAIMMESGELTRASTYLNSLITENSAEADFIDASNLYITYLSDRNNFVLSEIARESLRYKAMQPNELSGYIRSIYHALTRERISIVLPHTNLSQQGITNTIKSQVDKITSYPNPVIGDEHIVFIPNVEIGNKISINLVDMTGRIIETVKGQSGENTLDMSHVPLGLYIVEVVSDDIRIYTTKVVKL